MRLVIHAVALCAPEEEFSDPQLLERATDCAAFPLSFCDVASDSACNVEGLGTVSYSIREELRCHFITLNGVGVFATSLGVWIRPQPDACLVCPAPVGTVAI